MAYMQPQPRTLWDRIQSVSESIRNRPLTEKLAAASTVFFLVTPQLTDLAVDLRFEDTNRDKKPGYTQPEPTESEKPREDSRTATVPNPYEQGTPLAITIPAQPAPDTGGRQEARLPALGHGPENMGAGSPGEKLRETFSAQHMGKDYVLYMGGYIALGFDEREKYEQAKAMWEDNTYEVNGASVNIPIREMAAMVAAHHLTPFPMEYWKQKLYVESRFDAEARSASGGLGLSQVIPKWADELLHDIKQTPHMAPHALGADNIEKRTSGYNKEDGVSGEDSRYFYPASTGIVDTRAYLTNVLMDPLTNLMVSANHVLRYGPIKDNNIVLSESYFSYLLGPGRGDNFREKLLTSPKEYAYTMLGRYSHEVRNNKPVFFKFHKNDDGETVYGKPRTYAEMADYLEHERGLSSDLIPLHDPAELSKGIKMEVLRTLPQVPEPPAKHHVHHNGQATFEVLAQIFPGPPQAKPAAEIQAAIKRAETQQDRQAGLPGGPKGGESGPGSGPG